MSKFLNKNIQKYDEYNDKRDWQLQFKIDPKQKSKLAMDFIKKIKI